MVYSFKLLPMSHFVLCNNWNKIQTAYPTKTHKWENNRIPILCFFECYMMMVKLFNCWWPTIFVKRCTNFSDLPRASHHFQVFFCALRGILVSRKEPLFIYLVQLYCESHWVNKTHSDICLWWPKSIAVTVKIVINT